MNNELLAALRPMYDDLAERHTKDMRAIGNRIPVGGAHMPTFFRMQGIRVAMKVLRDGGTPMEAVSAGQAEMTLCIKTWNQKREWQVHFWEQHDHDWLANRILQIGTSALQCGKEETPMKVKVDKDFEVVAEYEECSGYKREYRVVARTNPINGDHFQAVYDVPEKQIHNQEFGPKHDTYNDAVRGIARHLEGLPAYCEIPIIHSDLARSVYDAQRKDKQIAAEERRQQAEQDAAAQAEQNRLNTEARAKVDAAAKVIPNKKGTTTITLGNGIDTQTKTISGIRVGWFIVYKSDNEYVRPEERYVVTHVPSGRRAGTSFSQADAKAMAVQLGRKGDWSKKEPKREDVMQWALMVITVWKSGNYAELYK